MFNAVSNLWQVSISYCKIIPQRCSYKLIRKHRLKISIFGLWAKEFCNRKKKAVTRYSSLCLYLQVLHVWQTHVEINAYLKFYYLLSLLSIASLIRPHGLLPVKKKSFKNHKNYSRWKSIFLMIDRLMAWGT